MPGRRATTRRVARLTFVVDVLRPVEVLRGVLRQRRVEFRQSAVEERIVGGDVAAVGAGGHAHALLPQVAHEQLQSDEGEDAEAEHGEDHHVRKFLHRLDQRADDGLQAWVGGRVRGVGGGRTSQGDYCALIVATSLCSDEAANKSSQQQAAGGGGICSEGSCMNCHT